MKQRLLMVVLVVAWQRCVYLRRSPKPQGR